MYMIVFTGLPGTGKSTVAEAIGRQLSIPVFAKDWLEAVVVRSGFQSTQESSKGIGYLGYELLTSLASRQLELGQSVILDSVASTTTIRTQWHTLATHYQAIWRVIECICTDTHVHQSRLAVRQRNIPDWHELTWADVERVAHYYEAWHEPHLVLDMVQSFDQNYQAALQYVLTGQHPER